MSSSTIIRNKTSQVGLSDFLLLNYHGKRIHNNNNNAISIEMKSVKLKQIGTLTLNYCIYDIIMNHY